MSQLKIFVLAGIIVSMLVLAGVSTMNKANADVFDTLVNSSPSPLLNTEYHPFVQRPLEYVGFSFGGPLEELRAMQAAGANAVGLGGMWVPERDLEAPDGLGFAPPPGGYTLSQVFVAERPFSAFAPHLATIFTEDSGCSWRLHALGESADQEVLVAEGYWRNVEDNTYPEANFETQAPGTYRFELHEPVGSLIAWWLREDNPYPEGKALLDQNELANRAFQFRVQYEDGWVMVVSTSEDHTTIRLGPSPFDILDSLGMKASYQVGNWNNPGFTYYPEWFFEDFPETIVLDQYGNPFLGGGMFEREVPTPNIESVVIKHGTRRFMEAMIRAYQDSPALLFYVLGGEELYATYMDSQRWTDYSSNAIRHFQAWLEEKRYSSLEELNLAWNSALEDFSQVDPPRFPSEDRAWLDWIDFRFETMGERIGFHYQTVRNLEPERLAFTCNHGSLFHHNTYAAMGARLDIFAAQSDGFETGQIIEDSDPEYYNIKYIETILGLGKPYAPVRLAYKKSDPAARGGGTSYTPEAVRRYGYETLGSGAWNLGFIQWSGSLPDGEWGVEGTPAEEAIKEFHAEIADMVPELEGMYAVQPRLGVFLSHQTWALRGYQPSWLEFHKAAIQNHVPKVYVYDNMVQNDQIDKFPFIVSIDNTLIDDATLAGLVRYVEGGGNLVIAGLFGESGELPEGLRNHPNVRVILRSEPHSILNVLGDSVRPVRIQTQQRVRRLLEHEITGSAPRTPVDLAGNRTLGQTVRVDRSGLKKIAIQMPTYTQQPPIGFTLEIRKNDPEGALIEQFSIPKEIGDNTWVEVELTQSPPVGDILYVGVLVPGALPAAHLGWWSSTQDVYSAGTAYVNGRPVTGDRYLKMIYHDSLRAQEAVEVFLLSDGLNYAVVLVNIAADPIRMQVNLESLLDVGLNPDAYRVSAQLRPDNWQGQGLEGELLLPEHDAEVLFINWTGDVAMAAEMVLTAESILRNWSDVAELTSYQRHLRDSLNRYQETQRWHKALAAAVNTGKQLGLQVTTPEHVPAGGTAELRAHFFNADGSPATLEKAWVEVTPSQGLVLPLEQQAPGVYVLTLSQDILPTLYDYAVYDYAPYTGPVRLRVYGEKGQQHASELVDIQVGTFLSGTFLSRNLETSE